MTPMCDVDRARLRFYFGRLMHDAAKNLRPEHRAQLEPWQVTLCRKVILSCLGDLAHIGYGPEALRALRAMSEDAGYRQKAA